MIFGKHLAFLSKRTDLSSNDNCSHAKHKQEQNDTNAVLAHTVVEWATHASCDPILGLQVGNLVELTFSTLGLLSIFLIFLAKLIILC